MASSASTPQTIARLMEEGLEHYGQDRVDRAVECWRAVLKLDPRHAEARDFLRSAGFEADEAPKSDSQTHPGGLVLEAVELCRCGQPEQALELLETLQRNMGDDLHLQGYVELIRAHLYETYMRRLDGGKQVPVLRMGPEEIMRFNLPPNAGFVLAMIDGCTSVNDTITLAGMDPFEVLHTIQRLADAGIVEMQQ